MFPNVNESTVPKIIDEILLKPVELAWRSGSLMDCHATARGSVPGGNPCKNRTSRPSLGTVNGGDVSK